MLRILRIVGLTLLHLFNAFSIGCLMDNWMRVASWDNMFLGIGTLATVCLICMSIGTSLLWQYGFDE